MSQQELVGLAALVHVLSRALVAKGLLSKEDLLAELSRIQLAVPSSVAADLQELIQNLPDQ